jgi:starch-binding outer membrane protein, SusD/RagB family
LPIDQDATWDYEGRYSLKVATANDRYNIEPAYTTVKMHFDRENRFYASVGFDGGKWFGQGKYDDSDMWTIKGKLGQHTGIVLTTNYSPTGYWPKKLVHYQNYFSGSGSASYSVVWYPVIIMRLADLYLLYAEAKNEADGPNAESYKYINKIRNRAGLIDLEEAWTNFAKNPNYHTTKDGLREIIHQERQIELAFESHRLYDLRRWKKAIEVLNQPIKGWSVNQSTIDGYYKETTVFTPEFKSRNQLEPIKDKDLLTNMNLVQNPGW